MFLSIKAFHPFCFSIGDIFLPSSLWSPLLDRRGQIPTTNGPTHNSNLRPELCWPSLHFSDTNALLSFTLSFSSICPLMSKGGCSLISLINHLWHSARSLIHSNLSVACSKLGSPHHRRGHRVFDTVIYRHSLGVLFFSFSVFYVESSSYNVLSTYIT